MSNSSAHNLRPRWGLRRPTEPAALRIERRWRAVVVLGLLGTIPAFYIELLEASPPWAAALAYALAGLFTAAALLHTAQRTHRRLLPPAKVQPPL
jgi:voltage-gated potassium channel